MESAGGVREMEYGIGIVLGLVVIILFRVHQILARVDVIQRKLGV